MDQIISVICFYLVVIIGFIYAMRALFLMNKKWEQESARERELDEAWQIRNDHAR